MDTQFQFKTNLNCGSCVATVTPFLNAVPGMTKWNVDTNNPEKPLTVNGSDLSGDAVKAAVAKAGFKVLGDITPIPIGNIKSSASPVVAVPAQPQTESYTYYPIFLLAGFLVGIVSLVEIRIGSFDAMRSMANFMGAFFLTFSFFKLLDIRGFASAYSMYDVVAKQFPAYGFVYPFLELSLGIAYITGFQPQLTNIATLIIMTVSSIGVIQSVLNKKAIRCACLGTVFQLPMSTITIVEDTLMVLMSLAMLIFAH